MAVIEEEGRPAVLRMFSRPAASRAPKNAISKCKLLSEKSHLPLLTLLTRFCARVLTPTANYSR